MTGHRLDLKNTDKEEGEDFAAVVLAAAKTVMALRTVKFMLAPEAESEQVELTVNDGQEPFTRTGVLIGAEDQTVSLRNQDGIVEHFPAEYITRFRA